MEETLRRLKETHNEKDFTAIVESMRRKIKKGTLDYNLYLFEQVVSKLDPNKKAIEISTEGSDEIEDSFDEDLTSIEKKLDEMIEFCNECCRNFDQEIILSQLEEESKELLEGFKYE